jgi:undecaprenyl diphosphate synthase
MAAQNWKSRAESMLSQFINNDDINGVKSFVTDDAVLSYLQDNSSTSSALSCSYGVYDRLLGCDCVDNGANIAGNGPCVSLILAWVRLVLGRVMRVYLSNPLLLAFVPLFVGVGFGILIGRRSVANSRADNRKIQSARCNLWVSITDFLLLVLVGISKLALHTKMLFQGTLSSDSELFVEERDEKARKELKSLESKRESGVDLQSVPRHIAVIMDGNRRYGKLKYGNATRGHWDGSKTLIEFTKWCMAEGIQALTVYAFSTENWDRDPSEVSALMSIFCKYCEELRVEALERGIRIHVLETESERIPLDVRKGIDRMVSQTKHCDRFTMNICLSYGSRGEIVNACKSISKDVMNGVISVDQIGEMHMQQKMLTYHCCDPDVIIRTSGEERLSNFLLWQSAYSELFFLKKQWPELQKEDLIEVIRGFAKGRERRYGK